MPAGRSSTLYHKSPRSPAPPTPTTSSSRPFLPPSYYAAAGGLSPREISRKNAGNLAKRPTEENAKRGHLWDQASDTPSESESLVNRKTDERAQRSELHSGIPHLETQLLPSLRDTIDRMTGAPLRASVRFETGTRSRAAVAEVEAEKTNRRSRNRRNSPDSPPPVPSKKAHSRPPPVQHIPQPRSYGTPNIVSDIYPHQSTPSTSHLKEPAVLTLKSSFRSPVPASASPKPSAHVSNPSPSMAGSSLKSMKSLLSRKCSDTLKSPFNSNKANPRTDATNTNAQASVPSIPSKKYPTSNIPRPRTRYYNDGPTRLEDSDLDRRYEDDLRNRRKLTVANAAVSVSGSSSTSSEADSRNESYPDQINDRYHDYPSKTERNWKPAVGLGLSIARPPYSSPRTPRQEDVRANPPEKNLRFSLPVSESDGSHYSDEFSNYEADAFQTASPRDNSGLDRMGRATTFEDRRKSPDLRKARNGRHVSPKSARPTRSPTLSVSDHAEECVAEEETESEREGYTVRRLRVKESRGRSSSCEPKIFGSPELESDGAVPVVPRRTRSACPRDTPSPRTSRMFPSNLRDLIKSRNSFGRTSPPTHKDAAPVPPTPSPRITSRAAEHTNHRFNEPEQPRRRKPSPDHRLRINDPARKKSPRRHPTEALTIVEGYRSAAARERQAFGIPPSDSDEILEKAADGYADTRSSDRTMWQNDTHDELSEDAESILKMLEYEDTRRYKGKLRAQANTPRLSVISPSQSGSSGSDELQPQTLWNQHNAVGRYTDQPASKARDVDSLTDDTLSKQDIAQTREGVMQEIFETEEDLLRLFRICVRLFIRPLRVQNSKSWISGVPPNVAKLFDWFDDIVTLHEEIYESLCLARDTMTPTTDRVSEVLRHFVLNAEVYQPYLVRLSDVSEEIMTLTDSRNNDLGQFISLQQRQPECESWSLERFLMLPVNRLAAYQDLFARMLDLTPKSHQDYLSTFALSRSTDMVIRVMTEVKIREDEYILLKTFAARVQGLLSPSELATRERRLLQSGPLALVDSDLTGTLKENRKSSTWNLGRGASRTKRVSKLMDAISGSSSTVFEKAEYVNSDSTSSSFGANVPATSTPLKSSGSSWFSRLPLGKRSASKGSKTTDVTPVIDKKVHQYVASPPALKTVSVHAFIFNDLVLVAQAGQTFGSDPQWVLYEDLGVFRPLSIAQIQSCSEGTVISLESMALDLEHLNDNADFRTVGYRTVDFLLPRSMNEHPTQHAVPVDSGEVSEQTWLLAFRRCCKTTLRKLTFPGVDQSEDSFDLSDRTFNTHAAVSSLVASGLPIPRSPSGTFPDMRGGPDSTFTGGEREERGWWSLRYRQVFRELQRQDSLLSEDDDSIDI